MKNIIALSVVALMLPGIVIAADGVKKYDVSQAEIAKTAIAGESARMVSKKEMIALLGVSSKAGQTRGAAGASAYTLTLKEAESRRDVLMSAMHDLMEIWPSDGANYAKYGAAIRRLNKEVGAMNVLIRIMKATDDKPIKIPSFADATAEQTAVKAQIADIVEQEFALLEKKQMLNEDLAAFAKLHQQKKALDERINFLAAILE